MDTFAPAYHCHAARVTVHTTQSTAFVDLTDRITRFVLDAKVRTGVVTVQTMHTTTGLVVNEAEPLLLVDFAAFLDRLAPRASFYHHDDMARRPGVPPDEPANGHAHCRALLLPTSASLTVVDGSLQLGRWQRILFVDLDGPRRRDVSVLLAGEPL